jgi:hypothetical protein
MIGGTALQFSRNCFTCSFGTIPNSSVSLPSGALAVNFGTSLVAVLLILPSAKKEFSFLIWSLVNAILPPYVSLVLRSTKPTIAGKKHKINRQVRRIGRAGRSVRKQNGARSARLPFRVISYRVEPATSSAMSPTPLKAEVYSGHGLAVPRRAVAS